MDTQAELQKAKEILEALLGARRMLEERCPAGARWWEDARKVDSLLHDFLGAKHGGDRELLVFLLKREPRINIAERLLDGRLASAGQREGAAKSIAEAYYRNAGAVLNGIEAWRFALAADAETVRSGVVDAAALSGFSRAAAPPPPPPPPPSSPSAPAAPRWEPPRSSVETGPLPGNAKGAGIEFVEIPAGTFWMGSGDDDSDAYDDEKPRHQVTISRPFAMGKYPVTQAQWEAVMGNNPSHFKGLERPVEMVSWDDVQEFIRKLNAREGHNRYRLPTEAEWEYACRAGSTSRYCFGDDESGLWDYAWYHDNSRGEGTHPVGWKKPNVWGLYDMHGNVWEWCSDWYGSYSAGSVIDPQGPSAGGFRVLRGGGWDYIARYCRAAARYRHAPGSRRRNYGFRLVLSPGH